jgi:phosphoserine phosphatase
LRDLVKDMGFDSVLCSEMEKSRPWKYKFLCYGKNKADALERSLEKPYKIIRAYSDSKADLPVMRLAVEQVWINPKTGCRIAN